MPRPSLKAQRSEEILDAFERCVAKFGIDGATLEHIAEEAGMQRSLLRHNIGNREDLIEALINRFLHKSQFQTKQLTDSTIDQEDLTILIDYLFDEAYSDSQMVLVAEALILAAPQYPELSLCMKKWTDDFVKTITEILHSNLAKTKKRDCREVAAGIVGIYFNVESLASLGEMRSFRKSSKNAAMRLLKTLE